MITVTLLDNPFERSNRIIETVSRPGGADIAALVSDEYEYVEVNGVRVGERHYVEDGDYVVAMRMPGGSGFDPVTFLLYMAASVAISYGINAIMPPPEGPTERDAEKSPTYGFSRMKNIRGENQPIPVIYGEHRVAGTIVNESVEVFNATGESTYRALVVVSEGPIYSIAGQTINTPATDPLTSTDELLNAKIFLNGNALSNFHGVNAWVRLGTLDQEYVPGFEKAKRTYDVNVFLSQEEGTVATWSISDYNETSDEIEARWDEYGFGWDVPDQGVDGVDVIVNFPQGLYRLVSNNANSTPWVLGLRFCALDGNGNPLLGPGQGGNQDDGWVRLPFEAFDLRHQGAFQLSFPTSFYNPLDHTGALPGDSLKMDPGHLSWLSPACYFSTTNDLSSTFRPSDWNDSDVVEGFTFETWIKFDTTDGAGGFSTDNTPFDSAQSGYLSLLEWSSDGDGNGVWYGFKIEDGEWYPHMKVGKWLRTVTWPAVNMPANEWVHVVWSHKRNSSSENSNKFWKNGQIKGNISRNLDIIVPKGPVAPIHFGRRTTGGSDQILNEDWYVRGEWDETLVLARASNQDYVNQRYNGGAGQRQTSSGNPDIVVGYHFDNSYVDLGIYQNDATPVGASGYSFVDEGGVVAVTTAPERTRGRYRIQAMRINYESSEDDDGERRRMDEAEWQLAVTWLDEAFTYPSAAYYGIEVPATEQLNTSAPNITAVCQGRMVRIWDGLSTTSPTFTKEWSQSPAWNVADMAVDTTYGGGRAFPEEKVNWDSVQEWADECGRRVYDGRGKRHFYRQTWEADNNYVPNPEAFDAGTWGTASASVVADTDVAPDGTTSADTLSDANAGAIGVISIVGGSQPLIGPDPAWWCASILVKKDSSATGFSPSVTVRYGSAAVWAVWNNDTGAPIQSCVVEEYDDDWWWIKIAPYYYGGGGGSLKFEIRPAHCTYGTTTTDATLQGYIVCWGAFAHRGREHLRYPDDAGVARATLYMADVAEDGITAQTIPTHWVVGYAIRLSSCNDSDWDTDTTSTTAMTIQDIEVADNRDGYRRTWIIRASWYSDDATTYPSSEFPNLVVDGWDWEDTTNWTIAGGGTLTQVYDDGTTGNRSPLDPSPLLSNVVRYNHSALLGNFSQLLTNTEVGADLKIRAFLAAGSDGADILFLRGDADGIGGGEVDQHVSTEALQGALWEALEIEVTGTTATPLVAIHATDLNTDVKEVYADAVGAWWSEDASGNVPGGTIEGSETLFEYDAVHDTFEDLWDTLINASMTARATPVVEGDRLKFKVEKARTPVGMITAASTYVNDEYTFRPRWNDPSERENSLTVDFWDRNLNWESSSVSRDHPSIESTADASLVRPQPHSMKGVTRRSQVVRYADWRLALANDSTVECEFKSLPTALPYEPGDLIVLANELMPWGQSGRLMKDHSSGKNLVTSPQDLSDATAWNIGTGLIITPNVIGTTDGPKGNKVYSDTTNQRDITQTVPGITTSISYCCSFRARKGTSEVIRLRLVQTGGQNIRVHYDFAADTWTEQSSTGVQLTKWKEGDGWVKLACEIQSANSNDISIALSPEMTSPYRGKHVYFGDIQLEANTDRPTPFETVDDGLVVDRQITLGSGTYYARITSTATGASEVADVDSPASTYERGDIIEIDEAALSFYPRQGDEYSIYTADELFEGVVTSIGLNEDLTLDIAVAEYVSTQFDGDNITDDLEVYGPSDGGANPPGTDGEDDGLIPNPPESINVIEGSEDSSGNTQRQNLRVTWVHDPDTLRIVERTEVYIGVSSIDTDKVGGFQHVATAPGSATEVQFPVPYELYGSRIRIVVQPVSRRGAKRAVRESEGTFIEMSKYPAEPDPPTSFNAHMEGDQITFTWNAPSNSYGLIYEIRLGGEAPQGGWVLAQVVGETQETSYGPTSRWANARSDQATYYIRARNSQGVYSEAATIQYAARVLNATILTSSNYWYAFASQHWHDYADGWITDSTPPVYDAVANNLQRHTDGYLEFTGSKLWGTYKTTSLASATPEHFKREEPLRIEAVVVATCLNPTVIGDGRLNDDGSTKYDTTPADERIDWPFQGNVTLEGHLQSDLPTLKIQMKLIRESSSAAGAVEISTDTDASGSDGWLDYRPGLYPCHGAQFRLYVTRPTSDWDVRIHEFSTSTVRLPDQRHYRTPVEQQEARRLGLG